MEKQQPLETQNNKGFEKELARYPLVALAGRVNVGKSTLFNRCIGEKKAVTAPIAGTTRDVNYGVCQWRASLFMVADTGGFVTHPSTDIEKKVAIHVQAAVKKAAVILFVVDAKEGLVADDLLYLKKIRSWSKVPCLFVANKADKLSLIQGTYEREWLKTGMGRPHAVSAATGLGVGDLLDEVVTLFPPDQRGDERVKPPIQVSIIGRTNVGKSSLLNKVLGEERVIVSAEAHTTREPQDTAIEYNGQPIIIIDTVGIRKKTKVSSSVEREGVIKSIANIKKSDVAILVFDGSVTPSKQESRLASIAVESGAGILLVINKWDIVEGKDTKSVSAYEAYFRKYFSFVSWAPFLFTSALTGQRTSKILESISLVEANREKWLTTEELEVFLKKAITKQKPNWILGRKKPIIFGFSQISIKPPTFELLVKERASISFAYLRYLENRLREQFGFEGVPIRIHTEKRLPKKTKAETAHRIVSKK